MSGTKFVGVIPGAIDDLGTEHRLSWSARSMLLWLAVTVDRETGELWPVTINAIAEATAQNWHAVRRALDELEAAGGVELDLSKGHDGRLRLLWHDRIVWKKGSRRRSISRVGAKRPGAMGRIASGADRIASGADGIAPTRDVIASRRDTTRENEHRGEEERSSSNSSGDGTAVADGSGRPSPNEASDNEQNGGAMSEPICTNCGQPGHLWCDRPKPTEASNNGPQPNRATTRPADESSPICDACGEPIARAELTWRVNGNEMLALHQRCEHQPIREGDL